MSTVPADELRALSLLCALAGVHTEFTANDGVRRQARPSTLVAVLRALGIPVADVGDAPEAVRAMTAARARRAMEPVQVQWVGERRSVRLVLPADTALDDGWHELELEDGTVRRRPLSQIGWSKTGRDEVDGRTLDTYELPLDGGGRALPPGYHRLTVHASGALCTALVLVAPTCPLPTRGWGTFLPLHALRTDHDRGVGTYADLARLAQWTGHAGGALVGTLPLYPVFLEEPVDPSPYRPVTKLGWSELYIDPAGLPELAIAPEARRLLDSDALRRQVEVARSSRFVAYGEVMAILRSVLAPMAAALFATPSLRRSELEVFAAARPELAAYARFRSTCDRIGSSWADWTTAEASTAVDGTGDDAEHFHLYIQWVAEQQLASVGEQGGAGLYLDIPVGVHPSGFDPWWQGHAFANGVSGGAPPDAFFSGGQNWGFPPLHPEGLRNDGYRYLRAQMSQSCRYADAVRVDHIMGLDRLYWLPHGCDEGEGAYVQYRNEEMRAVVALEASRSGTAVVGEDLGTVPERVRAAMAHDGMLRSWVFQFETSPAHPLPAAPERSLASWGTHDLPRFAAYWEGDDIDDRERSETVDPTTADHERVEREANRSALRAAMHLDGHQPGDTGELLRACLRHMAAGPALLMLVDLEDLWLEREPQNRPGTGPEMPNWRLRAAKTLEEAGDDAGVVRLLREVDGLRKELTPVGPTVGPDA
ncbi:MAG TPA: 4-alpha-glucanotransferase [Acidimicrobiales bacterium]|nr:4-alpha-glucanotransferase [Acidimicrobiales bacterium]